MFNWTLIVMLLIGFVDYLGIGLVYPIFAALLFDTSEAIVPVGASDAYRGAMLGILIGLTPISQFLFSPLLGAFSDLKGRRIALLIGIATGCIGYLLAVVAIWISSLSLLFLYRILVGVSDATAAVGQATLADISTEENKARRFALLGSSFGFGFTVGPFVGGKLLDPEVASWFGYDTPFMAAGLMCIVNLLLVLFTFPETRQRMAQASFNVWEGIDNIRRVFLLRRYRWLFVAGFSLSFGWAFFAEFIPVLLRERLQYTASDVGNFYAYTGLWYAMAAAIGTAPLLKRFPPEKLVEKALLCCAGSMLLFVFIYDAFYVWLSVPFLMYTLAIVYPTASSIVSNRTDVDRQGEVLGTFQSVQACAMGLSPLFVGAAVGTYPVLTAWGGAFFMLCASLAFYLGVHVIPDVALKSSR